jgi:hypothetical protein
MRKERRPLMTEVSLLNIITVVVYLLLALIIVLVTR